MGEGTLVFRMAGKRDEIVTAWNVSPWVFRPERIDASLPVGLIGILVGGREFKLGELTVRPNEVVRLRVELLADCEVRVALSGPAVP